MRVNGKNVTLESAMTLADYLAEAGFNAARVVVERNGEIITREHFADVALHADDKLEVVQFVGGG